MSDQHPQNRTPGVAGLLPIVGARQKQWFPNGPDVVVLNPEARPIHILTWCVAEMQSLRSAANLMLVDIQISSEDFKNLIHDRVDPLATLLEHAVIGLLQSAVEEKRGVDVPRKPDSGDYSTDSGD